jgi:malonate transporter
VAPIGLAKLVLHPLCVLLAIFALPLVGLAPLEQDLGRAALLMAAMPMMSVYPILAHAYGYEERSAAALLVTTVASFFTLSGLLYLLK